MRFLPFLVLTAILLQLPVRACASEEGCFIVGYGEKAIPADLTDGSTYYVAGYRNDQPATGILDDQYAKAVYIEDAMGKSVLLISIDCVGLSGAEVSAIRSSLLGLSKESGCRDIHIVSTHDHAGVDTLGLWGKEGCDGKNASFSEKLREAAVEAARLAYAARTKGDLYFGSADTSASGIQEDTRLPDVFDPNLYCFRFEPEDRAIPGIRIVNYASHAESLDADNTLISADFPAYAAKYVYESTRERMIWF
ncbi:MAG: neutral/alkaline non-lysosomal ceramidase N-terminal domain-containing protein, partial [Clostridia bacterium]|nr:neutral/alkaline non-lysosomal ceramidase N-terminal domain-containing protein [Clostridia bacterium]